MFRSFPGILAVLARLVTPIIQILSDFDSPGWKGYVNGPVKVDFGFVFPLRDNGTRIS